MNPPGLGFIYVALFSVLSCYALLLLCYYLLRGL